MFFVVASYGWRLKLLAPGWVPEMNASWMAPGTSAGNTAPFATTATRLPMRAAGGLTGVTRCPARSIDRRWRARRAPIQPSVDELRGQCDALVPAGGATMPRDLKVRGRELAGIHFAMDYLGSRIACARAMPFLTPI